jgi:hypothetical protein
MKTMRKGKKASENHMIEGQITDNLELIFKFFKQLILCSPAFIHMVTEGLNLVSTKINTHHKCEEKVFIDEDDEMAYNKIFGIKDSTMKNTDDNADWEVIEKETKVEPMKEEEEEV